MPTTLSPPPFRNGEYIVSEGNNYISREQGVISSTTDLFPGTVLGFNTTTKVFGPLNLSAADGTQTPSAILYDTYRAVNGNQAHALHVRSCEVNGYCLTYPAGITAAQQLTVTQALAANGIITRT